MVQITLKLPLLLVVFSAALWAQVPTISNVATDTSTNDSIRVSFDVSPPASWVAVQVGTVSGTYTGQTKMYLATNDGNPGGHAALAVTGLAFDTDYYLLPIAQPNETNATDRCAISACGSVEQHYKTGTNALPLMPTAPTAYNPVLPDISAYLVVHMANTGAGGEAVAVAPVPALVTVGDTIQTVLNEITPRYRVRFSQSTIYHVIPNAMMQNTGYVLPQKTNDTVCSNGWIVLETERINPGDFPPDGVSTDPILGVRNAIFQADTQAGTAGIGQIFTSDWTGFGTVDSRCYWLENLTLQVDPTVMTGSWGTLATLGTPQTLQFNSDNMVARHLLFKGSPSIGASRGVNITGRKMAVLDSWFQDIWATPIPLLSQGVLSETGGQGPYNISNNQFNNVIGETFYQECFNGSSRGADNVTVDYNTFYINVPALIAANRGFRQPVEFKCGHHLSVSHNTLDGSIARQNEGPTIFLSGTNDWVAGNGISDVHITRNIIRQAPAVLDCFGVRIAENAPASDMAVTHTVLFDYNLAYNNGLNGRVDASMNFNSYFWLEPGCSDLTITQNSLGLMDPADTRPGTVFNPSPLILLGGGNTTYLTNFQYTNNVDYVSLNQSPAAPPDRIFLNVNVQTNPSYPILPSVGDNTVSPSARLNNFAITYTNAGAIPALTWGGNKDVCGLTALVANVYASMDQTACTAAQTGMPSGDTYPSGASISAREAALGLDGTTLACSGCGGAGMGTGGKTEQLPYIGVVIGIGSPTPTSTAVGLSYAAPDSRACYIDLSIDSGTTYSIHQSDGGGATSRTATVSGLTPNTAYVGRLLCYKQQLNTLGISSESWPSDQITSFSFMTSGGFPRRSGNFSSGGNLK